MTYQSKFLQTLHERGFIHQQTDTDGLDKILSKGEKSGAPVVAYIGFDCTAKSLHVGSLLQIMTLRWFQQCGHKPIVLLGGGTTKIGDPSGKDESRKMLSDEQIQENMDGIRSVFESFLEFGEEGNGAILVNNDDWLSGIHYIELLHYVGNHFSINRMLSMDSVKNRLDREYEMSFLEFNYMIMQAFDFHILNGLLDCRLQMGGSDQWGNIVMGTDLNRRIYATNIKYIYDKTAKKLKRTKVADSDPHKQLFGLTTPLITTASGAKMGKTADGAVWLSGEMLAPYDYWQFWRNTEDADVVRFLQFFTDLPMAEIQRLGALEGAEINEAKKILATHATAMLHGREAAEDARRTAEDTFEKGKLGEDLPEFTLPRAELEAGIPAFKLFHLSGLTGSGKEARKLIQGGGARVNDDKVEEENQPVTLEDMTEHGVIKLSAGKKKHLLVRVN